MFPKLRNSACQQPKGWVALSFIVVCHLFTRLCDTSTHIISTIWPFRPYQSYIFWKLLGQGYQNKYTETPYDKVPKNQHVMYFWKEIIENGIPIIQTQKYFWKQHHPRYSQSRTVVQGPALVFLTFKALWNFWKIISSYFCISRNPCIPLLPREAWVIWVTNQDLHLGLFPYFNPFDLPFIPTSLVLALPHNCMAFYDCMHVQVLSLN